MKETLIKDIQTQAGGVYSMNARGARWYAYVHNAMEDEIYMGTFVWLSEGEPTVDQYDGYIDLKTGKITEL